MACCGCASRSRQSTWRTRPARAGVDLSRPESTRSESTLASLGGWGGRVALETLPSPQLPPSRSEDGDTRGIDVNSASNCDVSIDDDTAGTKGGCTLQALRATKSIERKNAWALTSDASPGPEPRRRVGSRCKENGERVTRSFFITQSRKSYLEQLAQEVTGIGEQVVWELQSAFSDLLKQLRPIAAIKRWKACEHLIKQCTERPPVHSAPVASAI